MTALVMEKPKGGRGHVAPYQTKQIRVPRGLEAQIQELVNRYRNWISQAGYSHGIGTDNPPHLLDKPVVSFKELSGMQSELEALRQENAQLLKQLAEAREDLAASQAEANDYLDACERWQMVANHTGDQLTDVLSSPVAKKPDMEATRDSEALLAKRDRYLASLRLGKQAPEYKRTKSVIDRFIAALQHRS